jgi:hypothetical protein
MLLRCFDSTDFERDWSTSRSCEPRSLAHFASSSEFILGHFTSSVFLDAILSEGLTPDPKRERSVADGLPSDSHSVYLASTFDRYYLKRAKEHHGGTPICIEVQVLRRMLTCDESLIPPDQLKNMSEDEALYRSLCTGGCKHRGPIAISSILSVWGEAGPLKR